LLSASDGNRLPQCALLQEVAYDLVNELVDPRRAPETTMVFMLYRISGVGISYAMFPNQLHDAETAFNLLHFLHHLHGVAFGFIEGNPIYHLNPAILRALTHHQRALGRPYQLLVRQYIVQNVKTDRLNSLLPITTGRQRGALEATTSAVDVMFIRAHCILVNAAGLDDVALALELAATLGTRCRKLRVAAYYMTHHVAGIPNAVMEVGLLFSCEGTL
jgi:hypothetical protein